MTAITTTQCRGLPILQASALLIPSHPGIGQPSHFRGGDTEAQECCILPQAGSPKLMFSFPGLRRLPELGARGGRTPASQRHEAPPRRGGHCLRGARHGGQRLWHMEKDGIKTFKKQKRVHAKAGERVELCRANSSFLVWAVHSINSYRRCHHSWALDDGAWASLRCFLLLVSPCFPQKNGGRKAF